MYLLGHGYLVRVWHGNNWGGGSNQLPNIGKNSRLFVRQLVSRRSPFKKWAEGYVFSREKERERDRAYGSTKRRHLAHLLEGNDRPNVRRHIEKFWIVPSSCREESLWRANLVFSSRQFRLSLIYVSLLVVCKNWFLRRFDENCPRSAREKKGDRFRWIWYRNEIDESVHSVDGGGYRPGKAC